MLVSVLIKQVDEWCTWVDMPECDMTKHKIALLHLPVMTSHRNENI